MSYITAPFEWKVKWTETAAAGHSPPRTQWTLLSYNIRATTLHRLLRRNWEATMANLLIALHAVSTYLASGKGSWTNFPIIIHYSSAAALPYRLTMGWHSFRGCNILNPLPLAMPWIPCLYSWLKSLVKTEPKPFIPFCCLSNWISHCTSDVLCKSI